jgi:hypothetical protein
MMEDCKTPLMSGLGVVVALALMCGCAVGAEGENALMRCEAIDKFGTKHQLQLGIDAKGKPSAITYQTMSKEGHDCLIEAAQGRSFSMRDSSEWTFDGDHVTVRVRDRNDIVANLTIAPNKAHHKGFVVEFQSISYEVFCGVRGFLATKIGVDRSVSNCMLFPQ